jgi:hypothetical protein
MRFLIVAAAFSVLAITPASAAKTACTPENMAKSTAAINTMPDGPGKIAASKKIAKVNTEWSKGNMRGACKAYMEAQAGR